MGWSREWVPVTIPLGCYMIADQVHSKFFSFFLITVQYRLGKYWIEGSNLVTCGQKMGPLLGPTDLYI